MMSLQDRQQAELVGSRRVAVTARPPAFAPQALPFRLFEITFNAPVGADRR